jgi:CPA1 family monovalent cation:H+ antiporter
MSAVSRFEIVLVLMAVIVGLDLAARRLRLPRAAALILGGIGIALIPGTPELEIDPELVLVLFLPPLLMSSAWFTSWRDFRADLRIILQLAVGAVFFTTLVVGVVAHLVIPGLPWSACFALGAIVSPPDSVAAKAVLQKVALPHRIIVLLEGESLVNDASGLVLLRFAVAAALTGTFSVGAATISFFTVAIGGLIVGIVFAFVAMFVIKRIKEIDLAIAFTFLVAWISYIAAEKLHVSGVLATVACGMILGWKQHELFNAALRTRATAAWSVVVFVLESLVFILIGLSLRGVLHRLGGTDALTAMAPATAAIIAAVVLARFVWMYLGTYLPRMLFPKLDARDPAPHWTVPFVMSWAGLRGVVSLAAALSLPEEFAGRDMILAITFAVILVTVLIQGSTLAPLVRLLLRDSTTLPHHSRLSEAQARARVAEAQFTAIEKASRNDDGSRRHPRLFEQYTYRKNAATRYADEAETLSSHRVDHFTTVLAAIDAGRHELLKMHRADEIHDSVLQSIEEGLDLEEVNARRNL